jgi:hypothetical protein
MPFVEDLVYFVIKLKNQTARAGISITMQLIYLLLNDLPLS